MQRRTFIVGLAVLAAPVVAARIDDAFAQSADFQARLAAYQQARASYDAEASVYWNAISDKRRIRNAKRRSGETITLDDYVLSQPPQYTGPTRPTDPNVPDVLPGERAPIPVIADFLRNANEHFGFVPDRPKSDADFKAAYARLAAAAGLTRDQIVGVYAFETGGNGTYDTQAGVTPTRPNAISPAMGYNQLLSTNSVSLLAGHGGAFLGALRQKANATTGAERAALERKIEKLKAMITFARSVPNQWSEHDKLAKTTAPGIGIHAAILDRDIGPMLQVQKLLNSVRFARSKHVTRPLTAAELELMNLTGDGNGIDMVMMPRDMRERVPTSNFFQQNGYERNPVARRTAVVAGLVADIESKMARGAQSAGARELAAAY